MDTVNGAAAGWPRKAAPAAPTARTAGPVNGAAAGWPRKAEIIRGTLENYRPSMGPRPDGRGRSATGFWVGCGLLSRQWGRGRMAAEGVIADPARNADGMPSMGPRPDGRGRLFRLAWARPHRTVNGAAAGWPRKVQTGEGVHAVRFPSMGPRPDGRGRSVARTGISGSPSVNGAAAGWPRKARSLSESLRLASRQWGRGRMAAEGGAPRRRRPRPFIRQLVGEYCLFF